MAEQDRTFEPAIPEHLRVPRTREPGVPETYTPVTKSFSARFKPRVTRLPMVYLGVQYRQASHLSSRAISTIQLVFSCPNGPEHWDRAEYVDECGYRNIVFVGYWSDKDAYEDWRDGLPSDWWHSGLDLRGEVGVYRECYTPGIEDTETTFSHPVPEGYSVIAECMSGEVREHGYWGSSRDRIPRSQTDALEPAGQPGTPLRKGETSLGRIVVVRPHENLCLLRSGQDWRDTTPSERKLYLEGVAPILKSGMDFLRDEGASLGCFFNRFMQIVSDDGPVDKTYSLSAWYGLGFTEKWAKASQHLAIFGAGAHHYNTMGEDAKLRIYHEMSVIRARDQSFEYFNCHPKTGMLNTVTTLP